MKQVGLFADGAAVRTTGAETYRVSKEYVDDMMTVNTDEICQVRAQPPLSSNKPGLDMVSCSWICKSDIGTLRERYHSVWLPTMRSA